MCAHGCSHQLDAPAPALGKYALRVHEDKRPECPKACVYPGGYEIHVFGPWWRRLSPVQQKVALAHELAHLEGAECERCADERAGAIAKRWGITKASGARAMDQIVKSRPDSGLSFQKGYDR